MLNTTTTRRAYANMSDTEEAGFFQFEFLDYAVFSGMLFLSALTGFYFGCRGRYCNSVEPPTLTEYLRGSGNLKSFPVAMSLIASYISGVTVLGTPAEIYNFGTQYWSICIAIWISGLVVANVYLPVFYKLQVSSSYEYLELRFNRAVRTLVSVLFVLDEIMFLPILIYVPSLAFNQVSGVDLHIIGTIVCIICIFYTVLGGLKAVVWTDTWQISVMFVSVLVVVCVGTVSSGGFEKVWEMSLKGNRINFFDFNPSMYERHTFFSVLIGGVTYWTSFNSVNQTMVQRYLSLPSLNKSKLSVGIFTIGISFFVSVCCFAGLLIFSSYFDCDPLAAGRIQAHDQLLPLYVMETVGHLKGIPGLFIAGVFGAALSSLSVVLNSTSTVFLEDFVKGCFRKKMREKTAAIFVKVVVLCLGVAAVGFLFIVEHMGGVLQMASSLSSIAAGTTFGVFTLGMLIPIANSKGTLIGAFFGALLSGWVSFGIQYAGVTGIVRPHTLPISIDQCPEKYGISANYTNPIYPDESDVFPLYRLSFHWITPIGVSTVVIVGTIASYLTGKTDLKYLDPDLLTPLVQKFMPEESEHVRGRAIKHIRRSKDFEQSIDMENLKMLSKNGNVDR